MRLDKKTASRGGFFSLKKRVVLQKSATKATNKKSQLNAGLNRLTLLSGLVVRSVLGIVSNQRNKRILLAMRELTEALQ